MARPHHTRALARANKRKKARAAQTQSTAPVIPLHPARERGFLRKLADRMLGLA